VLVLVAMLAVLVSGRAQWLPREQAQPIMANATQPSPVIIVTHGTMGTNEAYALLRAALAAMLNMSKKTEEHWIPTEPAPWQKLAKDCDRDLREEPFNGGCWVWIGGPPPCSKLFRYGDKCYRPVAADAPKPVGGFIPKPVREGTRMAPGTTNEGE